jgi:hypothetical protein
LGIDPSPPLQRLEMQVLTQDPALAAPLQTALRAAEDDVPFPTVLRIAERTTLVGRDRELVSALAAWAPIPAGGSGVFLISGEAGIGKSRLVRELGRRVHGEGALVLYGRCDQDLAIPYLPFLELLAYVVEHVGDDVLAGVDQRWLTELSRLVPMLVTRCPGLPEPTVSNLDVERYLLFGGVAALLRVLTREAPVMMILDDLQWADRSTLALLRHLVRLNLSRLLLVGAHRDAERPDTPLVETLGLLTREANVSRVRPSVLAASHVAELIVSITGQAAEEAHHLAAALHQETSGNPFFLVELLTHLQETGLISELPDESWFSTPDLSALRLPTSIRDVLRARVARLGPGAARVLSHAAVIGEDFDLEVLTRIVDLETDQTLETMEVAGRVALVAADAHKPDRFRFAHALVQQTLYGDLGPSRRTRIHARIATAMEGLGGYEAGQLAFHFLAGMNRDTSSKAVHYARSAGQRALDSSAPDEACRWFAAALKALPPPEGDAEHARALIDLGISQRQAGQPAYRDTLIAAAHTAERADRHDLMIQAALASNRGSFSRLGEVDVGKIGILEAALAVTPAESPERARLLAVMAAELIWHRDHHRRIAAAVEAVEVARRTGDPATLLFAILRPGPAHWIPETSALRQRLYREAFDLAVRLEDHVARLQALQLLAPTLLEQGTTDQCPDEDLDAAAAEAAEIQEPFTRWITVYIRGCMALAHSDLVRSEREATDALRIGLDGGLPEAEAAHDEQVFIIRWQQGRLAEVVDRLRAVGALLPTISTRQAELALAEALAGDREQAGAMLGEAAASDFRAFYGPPWLGCICLWADVAAELADPRAAAVLYTKLLPWKNLFATGGPLPIHAVSLALGRLAALVGDPAAACGHFVDAMRVSNAVRSPFGAAETALQWGRVLLEREPMRARHLLDQANQIATDHGFADLVRRSAGAITSL